MNARFYSGWDGRLWLYASEATYRCPYAEAPPAWMADELERSEVGAVEDGDTATGLDLVRVFKRAHSGGASGMRDPDDPTRCRACASYLEKVGYAAWAEEPWPSAQEVERQVRRRDRGHPDLGARVSSELSTRSIALRLNGPGALRRVPGSHRYFAKKVGADGSIAWCREQAQIDRAIGREEAEKVSS